MLLKRLVSPFVVFFFLIVAKAPAISQDIRNEVAIHDEWVDSVYNSLSMADRINQLLLVKLNSNSIDLLDSTGNYGGITINESKVHDFQYTFDSVNSQRLPPLKVHALGDPFGLNFDDVDRFGWVALLGQYREPHIYYELGTAIGDQCNQLGIDVLDAGQLHLPEMFSHDSWQLKEFNQGLKDRGVVPSNVLRILNVNSMSIFHDMASWDLIKTTPGNVDEIQQDLQKAIAADTSLRSTIQRKCKKVLTVKKQVQMSRSETSTGLEKRKLMGDPHNNSLRREMARFLIVAPALGNAKIPIQHIKDVKIAHLSVGDQGSRIFNEYANKYASVDLLKTGYNSSDEEYANLWSKLNVYDHIICTFYELDQIPQDNERLEGFMIFHDWIKSSGKSLSVTFLNERGISNQYVFNELIGELIVLDDDSTTAQLVPQVIFGGMEALGKIQISAGNFLKGHIGRNIAPIDRLSYTLPEMVGVSSEKLQKIDSIAKSAVDLKAMPGCQIVIAKDHHVIYHKAFGYHTYSHKQKVLNTDLYDLASVTKVSGALPCLMKLYEEGEFDLDATMGTYLPYFKRGNKKELTYREILAHQSGLFPYLVYWKTAQKQNGKFKRKTFSHEKKKGFSYELASGLFLHDDFKKKIYKQIRKSKIGEKKYSYSGLSFLLYPEIIESITGQKYTDYLYDNFYKPLGAISLTYNPLDIFSEEMIVPTEYDSLFRKSMVHGKVHDEAAAVMAGISSNAGLFANANDLAKLFQMYCNYGSYGGQEYLKKETVREFAKCQYPENKNRRGLGFDRPLPEPHENGNTAKSVSQLSFGHSGFTGTFAWVDPEYNLVYIFLSNRVYPTRENRKLYELNVRTNIQQVIYDALED